MRLVYEASNTVEAHMILNMLQQHGFTGRVDGEFLQGGVGELQAIGLVKVLVSEDCFDEAKRLLSEWEAKQPKELAPKEKGSFTDGFVWFFAGLAVGIFVTLFLYSY